MKPNKWFIDYNKGNHDKTKKMEVIGMSIKEEVIKIIQDLPDNATIEDIMHQLYVRAKIEAGLKELDQGLGIPHEEAMERISKWLN